MDEHEFEKAERSVEAMMEGALSGIRDAERPKKHPDFDGTHCVQCGAEMSDHDKQARHYLCAECEEMDCVECGLPFPAKRAILGKINCTHCQEKKERR